MNKKFLYARKSTDVEDKQVLSIEAQKGLSPNSIFREWLFYSAGMVDDIRTYFMVSLSNHFQSSTNLFYIPILSLETIKIN